MSLSDNTLISEFISGNSDSFSILLDRYQKRVYGFIFSKLNDPNLAEDIFNDSELIPYTNWNSIINLLYNSKKF